MRILLPLFLMLTLVGCDLSTEASFVNSGDAEGDVVQVLSPESGELSDARLIVDLVDGQGAGTRIELGLVPDAQVLVQRVGAPQPIPLSAIGAGARIAIWFTEDGTPDPGTGEATAFRILLLGR